MKVSLLISTYNRPDALELCLKSILNQVYMPDEIIIADDGSKEDTRDVIQKYADLFVVPLHHVWHEDNGFQLAMIRNKAIAIAMGDYIIQIDGDLILHPYFVKDHKDFAKGKSFVRGSRIYLDESITNEKIAQLETKVNRFDKRVSNFFSAIRIPFLRFLFEHKYKNKGAESWEIHGCNMAYWRDDAISVNGYDEDFEGWGPEDKEFVARLLNMGIKKRFLKLGAITYHLWHKINTKENLRHNEVIFEETKREKKLFCVNGIDKYLKNK